MEQTDPIYQLIIAARVLVGTLILVIISWWLAVHVFKKKNAGTIKLRLHNAGAIGIKKGDPMMTVNGKRGIVKKVEQNSDHTKTIIIEIPKDKN